MVWFVARTGMPTSGVVGGPVVPRFQVLLPSLSEFVTTVTELTAMAAAATIGFKKPTWPITGCSKRGTVSSLNIG